MFEAHNAEELRMFVLHELGMQANQGTACTTYTSEQGDYLRLYGEPGLYEFGVANYRIDHDFSARFSCDQEILRFGAMYEGRTFFQMEGERQSSFLPSVFVTYERDVRGMQEWHQGQHLCGAEFTLYPAFFETARKKYAAHYTRPLHQALEPNRTYRFMPMNAVAAMERLIEADRSGRLGPLAVQGAALEALDAIMEVAGHAGPESPFCPATAKGRYPLSAGRRAEFSTDELYLIERARDTLDRTYTHPRTIEALAKDLGLSPQKLKTGFQRLYHTTPGRYVANLRMTQGALLLRTTDVCVEVISARVGYAHPSNFIKAFRRAYSCTPAQYRKQER